MRRLRFGTVLVVATVLVGWLAVSARADDLVNGNAEGPEKVAPESAPSKGVEVEEEKKTLPPWFPGRLSSTSTTGLRLKSLEIFDASAAHPRTCPQVGYRAEFVCGCDELAERAWESPVEIFMVTYNEETQEQHVTSSHPVLRIPAGQPARVAYTSTAELPRNDHGSWVTVIVVGRNSAIEATRLLANQTIYVKFVDSGEGRQAKDRRTGAVRIANANHKATPPRK